MSGTRDLAPSRYLNEQTAVTLPVIGVAAGPIGNSTTVPVVTKDAEGRVTALTSAAITFPSPVKAHCRVAAFGSLSGFASSSPIPWNRTVVNNGFTLGGLRQVTIPFNGYLQVNFHAMTAAGIAPYVRYALRLTGDANFVAAVSDGRTTGTDERVYELNIMIPVTAGQEYYMDCFRTATTGFIGGDTNEFSWQSWVAFTLF